MIKRKLLKLPPRTCVNTRAFYSRNDELFSEQNFTYPPVHIGNKTVYFVHRTLCYTCPLSFSEIRVEYFKTFKVARTKTNH